MPRKSRLIKNIQVKLNESFPDSRKHIGQTNVMKNQNQQKLNRTKESLLIPEKYTLTKSNSGGFNSTH